MLNRYVCSVLDEMRKCKETGNYSYLPGLIEEVQTMVNRMEAKLEDYKEMKYLIEKEKDVKNTIKKLKEERNLLKEEVNDLEKKKDRLD